MLWCGMGDVNSDSKGADAVERARFRVSCSVRFMVRI